MRGFGGSVGTGVILTAVGTAAAVATIDQVTKLWTRGTIDEWSTGPSFGPIDTWHVEHRADMPGRNSRPPVATAIELVLVTAIGGAVMAGAVTIRAATHA